MKKIGVVVLALVVVSIPLIIAHKGQPNPALLSTQQPNKVLEAQEEDTNTNKVDRTKSVRRNMHERRYLRAKSEIA